MVIHNHQEFIKVIQSFNISTEYVVIKPNWVSNAAGEFTEPEILDLLLQSLPKVSKKIIVESYTPWRGKVGDIRRDLVGGKKYWDEYKEMDQQFLLSTGMLQVIKQYNAQYLNITDEYWKGNCEDPLLVKSLIGDPGLKVNWEEFYSYIPKKLIEIRNKSTLINLAKIKLETGNKNIVVSLSIKNLFGLIPHPSRKNPFHKDEFHSGVPIAIADIFNIYSRLYNNYLWINEGIKTMVVNYCDKNQYLEENKKLLFVSNNAIEADAEVCNFYNIDPEKVPYLKLI